MKQPCRTVNAAHIRDWPRTRFSSKHH